MKFGNIANQDFNRINFDLPPDHPSNGIFLAGLANAVQPAIEPAIQPAVQPKGYIGCSVWTDKSFVGKIYPQGTTTQAYLKLYSKHFNAVELNATFYSIPSVEQVKKWKASVNKDFKFCPKVPRSISHSTNLDGQLKRLAVFLERIHYLDENLGTIFLQLPAYFQPNRIQALQQLLEQIPASWPCAVEFRHPAWFQDQVLQQEVMDLLRTKQVATVISDVAGRRDVLHQVLTSNSVFIRFRGYTTASNNHLRIDAWRHRLTNWLEKGLQSVYFMVHETDKAFCIDLAIYLAKALNQQTALHCTVPHLVAQQGSLF